MKWLLTCLVVSSLAAQTPAGSKSTAPKQLTSESEITVSALGRSSFEDILDTAVENRIPVGIVIDGRHQLCQAGLNGGRRKETLAEFVADINAAIPTYEARFDGAVVNVVPKQLDEQTRSLLALKIPQFHSDSDSHQGIGVNLWMYIRAAIAPGEGTAFVGASSTARETVEGMNLRNEDVKSILNKIVVKGNGGAWVMRSDMIKGLSRQTPRPYDLKGYQGEEQAIRSWNCR